MFSLKRVSGKADSYETSENIFYNEDLNYTHEAEVASCGLSPPAPSTFEITDTDPSVPEREKINKFKYNRT